MTIKEASEITGISVDNLRYYERIGLIPPIPRNKSGIRDYDKRAIHWILFVMQFKEIGMPLETIIEYIKLANSDYSTKEIRHAMLLDFKKSLEVKMSELQRCLDVTNDKIENFYDMHEPITIAMINEWKNT